MAEDFCGVVGLLVANKFASNWGSCFGELGGRQEAEEQSRIGHSTAHMCGVEVKPKCGVNHAV